MTLYTALVTISKVTAPMIPFMAEEIYRNLVCSIDEKAPISVHLCDYPVYDETKIDPELEKAMEEVLSIVVLGRAARNASNIKNRQPIGKMYVKADTSLDSFYSEIIADELNVKEVEFTDNVSACTTYNFKPQLKTVGPKYGKFLGGIRDYLTNVDGNKAMEELETSGAIKFEVNGETISLEKEDLLIESAQVEGFQSESDFGITVVLDTRLSDELIEEGFVREIISKIQNMRKDSGFEVMDNINVYVDGNEKIAAIMDRNAEEIKGDVLALAVNNGTCETSKEWNINGEKVSLGVERV